MLSPRPGDSIFSFSWKEYKNSYPLTTLKCPFYISDTFLFSSTIVGHTHMYVMTLVVLSPK
jgi:hypothetical protein